VTSLDFQAQIYVKLRAAAQNARETRIAGGKGLFGLVTARDTKSGAFRERVERIAFFHDETIRLAVPRRDLVTDLTVRHPHRFDRFTFAGLNGDGRLGYRRFLIVLSQAAGAYDG
jgi:hypothetical protein